MNYDRHKYQKQLHEYTKRRARYQGQAKKCTLKIQRLKESLRRAQKQYDKLTRIVKEVESFTDTRLWNSNGKKEPEIVVAKAIFYRYALEEGLNGHIIANYTGAHRSVPMHTRKNLINTTNQFYKESWKRFKSTL